MRAIQIILIVGLLTLVTMYFRRFQSRALDHLSVLGLGVAGAVMVAVPDWTTSLANLVGVGRGADLLSYFGLVSLAFICLLLYAKVRSLESQLTRLARAEAIEHAHLPPSASQASE